MRKVHPYEEGAPIASATSSSHDWKPDDSMIFFFPQPRESYSMIHLRSPFFTSSPGRLWRARGAAQREVAVAAG